MIVIYDIILFKSYTNMEKMQIRAYTIGINMQISINIFCNSFSRIKVNDTIWKQSQYYTADDYKTYGYQIRTVTGIKTSGWPIENLVNIQLQLVIGGENVVTSGFVYKSCKQSLREQTGISKLFAPMGNNVEINSTNHRAFIIWQAKNEKD